MNFGKKGDWVEIHRIVLEPENRAPRIPEDTKRVPLEMRVKGFLVSDAKVGEEVEIKTVTGRRVKGKLTRVLPEFKHDFGRPIKELVEIGPKLREILKEVDKN